MASELVVTLRVRRRWLWSLRAALKVAGWSMGLVLWLANHPSVEVKC